MGFAQLSGVDVITRGDVLDTAMRAREVLVAHGVPQAIANKDARSLWGPNAPGGFEWLDLPYASRALIPDANKLIAHTHSSRLHHIVLLDSGETALAAKTIAAADKVPLTVADGVHPMRFRDNAVTFGGGDWLPLDQIMIVVSGKNGASRETDGHRRALEQTYRDQGMSAEEIAKHFLVITDPGSPLAQLAHRGGYPLVLSDPAIPDGFGALSAYALIPAALAGADIARLLQEAVSVRPTLSEAADNPGLLLGAILGGCAVHEDGPGRDKVAFRYPAALGPFFAWIEHLITASTGKQGRGLLPVDGTALPGHEPWHDMHSVALDVTEAASMDADSGVTGPLGAQILVWQYAAVVAAWLMGVNPFARPDAAQSDARAAALLRAAGGGSLPVGPPTFIESAVDVYLGEPSDESLLAARDLRSMFDALVRAVPVSGYLSLMSYVDEAAVARTLQPPLTGRLLRPVTHGLGPRCIDATGQYHKGGPGTGVFLVVTADLPDDDPIPGQPYSLATLRMARAIGDVEALRVRGRPVVWLHLRDVDAGLRQLRRAVDEAGAARLYGTGTPGGGLG